MRHSLRSTFNVARLVYNQDMFMNSDHTVRGKTPEPARVRCEAGERIYVGDIHLPGADFRNRVSDVLNEPERRFLPLLEVEQLDAATGRVIDRRPFMLIRVEMIDVVVPLVEPGEAQASSTL